MVGRMSRAAFVGFVILILIGVIYSLTVYFRLKDKLEAETIAADRAQAEMGARFITDQHVRLLAALKTMLTRASFLEALDRRDEPALQDLLQPLIAGAKELTGAALLNRAGRVIARTPPRGGDPLTPDRFRDWFDRRPTDGRPVVEAVFDRTDNSAPPVVVISLPAIGSDGRPRALLAVCQRLDFYADYFSRLTARHGRQYFIVDQTGRLIAGGGSIAPGLDLSGLSGAGSAGDRPGEPVTEIIDAPDGRRTLVAAAAVPEMNWTFIISHDYQAATAPIRVVMRNTAVFLILLFLGLTGLVLVILAALKVQKRALGVSAAAARRLETEVRDRTADLSKAMQRYRGLVTELPDVVYEVDREGRLTFVSNASLQLLGYRPEELIGRTWRELVLEEDRPAFQEHKFRAREGGVLHIKALRHLTKQGGIRWISINSRGLLDDRGELIGRLGIARDMSGEIEGGERIRQLSRRLIQTQEEERKRLALDLHDEMGQLLSALKIGLQALPRGDNPPPCLEDELRRLTELSQETMNKVRSLAYSLRPAVLDRFGLVPAIEDLAEMVSENAKMKINLDLTEVPDSVLSSEVTTTFFRFIQEGLTNAVRHSNSPEVDVSLKFESGRMTSRIRDYGTGFDVDEILNGAPTAHRFGLVGMRERLDLIGGEFRIESTPQGSLLTASLLLTEE